MDPKLLVGLATEILKFVNKPEAVKTIKEMNELQEKIDEEKARGQTADYGRIEAWMKDLERETKALLMFLAAQGVSK